jgi:hypothetical protein
VRAREILAEGLERHRDSGSLHYNLACLEAIAGQRAAALAALTDAIRLRPAAAAWAREDEDLASLRDDPQFRALVDRDSEPGE